MVSSSVISIIQARIGSTRLPGKILMDIAGEPMLQRVTERALRATMLDKVVVATTDLPEDDRTVELAGNLGLDTYRGSSEDVLERYYGAAEKFGGRVIVRITSDCPLIDPKIIDLVVGGHLSSGADYTSSTVKRTFPRGWDVEAFNIDAFKRARLGAKEYHQREHVTPYFREHPEEFKVQSVEAEGKLRRPDLRLCVDEADDLKLVRAVYDELGADGNFTGEDIIDLFERRPELAKINAGVKQKVK